MALMSIASPVGGFPHNLLKLLKGKCRIYIAKGTFDSASVPDTISELLALYQGSNAPFKPLGEMDSGGSNITWTQQMTETAFHKVGLGYEVTGTFVSVTVSNEMFSFLKSVGTDLYSFLFVPDGDTQTFFALNGVTVTTDGNLVVSEKDSLSKITFKASRTVDDLSDVIMYEVLAA